MAAGTTEVKILVPGRHTMVSLLGQRDELLKLIEDAFSTEIIARGNEITISGERTETERVATLFEELIDLLDAGQLLSPESIARSIDMTKTEEGRPREVLGDVVLVHRGKSIRPKTVGQKRYVDAIRRNTITFGIGPAGTGKTYLAMASAIKALHAKEFARVILTRPAVEAGEKLGFLPGTLYEKVDPYMRPLYDALYDMMDPEQIPRLMERGTIEVSPLAFMRGRAQPLNSEVLTPTGFRPIGELQVGDLVTGSDGRPTPVLGVYPQGRKEIFEVRTQDGASTICCGEHLWAVTTASDRRRGQPPRVLETQQMRGRLRNHRYEVPTLSAPAQLVPREVPMDPYALGRLLGENQPSDTTFEPVLAAAAVSGDEFASYTTHIRHHYGERTIPDEYLYNAPEVRLALLQGLLDTDGGSGTARSCRYVTTSAPLRDAVMFLVRSLGGVAETRVRPAGAYGLDIHLPAGIAPFRLERKAQRYDRRRGGRPMRFITSIEPVGEAETVCISVAAQDSLYVTDDFLVTHNTLNDSFIILDEAQNTTPEQMKMFLTRLGFGSKVVVTGDVTQVDLPSGQHSGLNAAREILTDIENLEFVFLNAKDVVRHKLVMEIVEAYRRFDESR